MDMSTKRVQKTQPLGHISSSLSKIVLREIYLGEGVSERREDQNFSAFNF
jgi:hypothetical protein